MIVAPGLLPTLAAKAATTSIPIVFSVGSDPVQLGLVASLNRPGGNLTGFNVFERRTRGEGARSVARPRTQHCRRSAFLRIQIIRVSELNARDVMAAAPALGLKVQILKASSDREIDAAFVGLVQARNGALIIGNDLIFNNRIEQLIALAARHAIPVMYPYRGFVVAGGLISYEANCQSIYRQIGLYAGRILKGEKSANLPVMQATKIELIINLKTARILGLEVPAKLFALADEVIE